MAKKKTKTFVYNKTSFLVFSDAQHSETHISCFPVVIFTAKERTWLKK